MILWTNVSQGTFRCAPNCHYKANHYLADIAHHPQSPKLYIDKNYSYLCALIHFCRTKLEYCRTQMVENILIARVMWRTSANTLKVCLATFSCSMKAGAYWLGSCKFPCVSLCFFPVQCPDSACKQDLLAYLQRIALYCHQLNICSKVKAEVQNLGGELIVSGVSLCTRTARVNFRCPRCSSLRRQAFYAWLTGIGWLDSKHFSTLRECNPFSTWSWWDWEEQMKGHADKTDAIVSDRLPSYNTGEDTAGFFPICIFHAS